MSIWTSRAVLVGKAALALCLALTLTGCEPGAIGASAPPVRSLALPGGMVIAGPAGFCVAQRSRQSKGGTEFVALTRCAAPGGAEAAVLTATVGPEGSAQGLDLGGKGLAAYFISPAGLKALSRSGNAKAVKVHKIVEAGGAVLIRLTDRSGGAGVLAQGGEGWRALFALKGQLITLSVQGSEDVALPGARARVLIDGFVAAMRRANSG